MPSFQPGAWLLYLNGIEVPAVRVDIQLGAGMVPSASIVLAPDRELIGLGAEDRVQVTVFYLDTHQSKIEGKDPDYRLIFEGEITSWNYQNAGGGRAMSFQAQGHAAILQRLNSTLMSSVNDIANGMLLSTADTTTSAIWPQETLFYQGLQPGPDAKYIKRPYDLVENIFRLLFGAAEFKRENFWTASPAAHFFARWARRTNFINRWAPSPFVEGGDLTQGQLKNDLEQTEGIFPMLKAFQGQQAIKALKEQSGVFGAGESLWGILWSIFSRMYYDITMLPNMPLVSYDLKTGIITGEPKWSKSTATVASTNDELVRLEGVLAEKRLSPETNAEMIAALESQIEGLTASRDIAMARTTVVGCGPEDPKKPVRLLNYVTKPQLHYCVPPRCNVIFPSMILDYMYGEDFANQPTRVYLRDDVQIMNLTAGNAGGISLAAPLRTGFPLAVRRFLRKTESARQLSDRNFLVYPEEYYRGPVIVNRGHPDWFSFLTAALSGTASKDLMAAIADTYAEYDYIQERGTRRTGAVNTIFNPYVVPGFPGVVIDQEETNVHLFCYIQNVTHSLSQDGMQTSINFSHAQTFPEFFKTYVEQNYAFDGRPQYSAEFEMAQVELADATSALEKATVPAEIKAAEQKLLEAQGKVAEAAKTASGGIYRTQAAEELAAAEAELLRLQRTSQDVGQLIGARARVASARDAYNQIKAAINAPDMVPAHPIPDIRARFQSFANANEYYTLLFQQGNAGRKAIFNWSEMLGVTSQLDNAPVKISFELGPTKEVKTADGTTFTKQVITNATENTYYTLMSDYKYLLTDPDLAMYYVARPIVTLDGFIDFHGDYAVKDGKEETYGHTYYARIFDYTQGPGEDPGMDENGYPLTLETADTRRNWERVLKNYRAKVRSKLFFKA